MAYPFPSIKNDGCPARNSITRPALVKVFFTTIGIPASFIEHATGKNQLRRLTVREASRVIEILKKRRVMALSSGLAPSSSSDPPWHRESVRRTFTPVCYPAHGSAKVK
jgi:hypothetical protein